MSNDKEKRIERIDSFIDDVVGHRKSPAVVIGTGDGVAVWKLNMSFYDPPKELVDEAIERLQALTPELLIADLEHMSRVSSSTAGAIMRLQFFQQNQSHDFVVAGCSEDANEMFRMTKLDKLFDIRASTSQVLEEFGKSDLHLEWQS